MSATKNINAEKIQGNLTATTINIQSIGGTTPISNLGIDVNGNVVTGTTGGGGSDTYVTGGTLSTGGTITLTRNDGGTVDITDINSGNAKVDTFYYSLSNSVDTRPFFDDGNVQFAWDETGNDLEFVMLTAPGGSGDMRSFAFIPGGSEDDTAITTVSVTYDLYPLGVSAGNLMIATIAPENDVTYPRYKVEVHNMGESFENTVKIERTTLK